MDSVDSVLRVLVCMVFGMIMILSLAINESFLEYKPIQLRWIFSGQHIGTCLCRYVPTVKLPASLALYNM